VLPPASNLSDKKIMLGLELGKWGQKMSRMSWVSTCAVDWNPAFLWIVLLSTDTLLSFRCSLSPPFYCLCIFFLYLLFLLFSFFVSILFLLPAFTLVFFTTLFFDSDYIVSAFRGINEWYTGQRGARCRSWLRHCAANGSRGFDSRWCHWNFSLT
jgi:hypothetical protein